MMDREEEATPTFLQVELYHGSPPDPEWIHFWAEQLQKKLSNNYIGHNAAAVVPSFDVITMAGPTACYHHGR